MPSFGKRNDGVTGRRTAKREDVLVQAAMFGFKQSQAVVLLDVSRTGAKLKGDDFPDPGSDVWIRGAGIDALATVAWKKGNSCGVGFDAPLSDLHVQKLRQDAARARLARLSPEEKLAAEDWLGGLAR